jgi:acetyltransferase-like isoleucine patch superfamily enzyme
VNRTPPDPAKFRAFGFGSVLVPPVRVSSPELIEIGEQVRVLEGTWLSVERAVDGVEPLLRIGDRVRIGRNCLIACVGSVTIEADVLTSDGVFIGDSYHDYRDPEAPVAAQPMAPPRDVVIGRGAFLGVHSVVLPGVSVGANSYVGAGAVVTRDVAPRTVVVGNPARPVRAWDSALRCWQPVAPTESAG